MVAIPGSGLYPARFLAQCLALVRSLAEPGERTPRPAKPRYPDRRPAYLESAAMSREMYRL